MAGDRFLVASDHAATSAAAVTITFPGTAALPNLALSIDKAALPTVTYLAGANESIGAASAALTVLGFASIKGVNLLGATNNSGVATISLATGVTPSGLILESCLLDLRTVAPGSMIQLGQGAATTGDDCMVSLINCTAKFGATGQLIRCQYGKVHIRNLALDATGSIPTTLFSPFAGTVGNVLVEGGDLSTREFINLVSVAVASPTRFMFRNIRLPASVNITTGANPGPGGPSVTMDNCDSADTNYRKEQHEYAGSVVVDSALYRAPGLGASSWMYNGATQVVGISHKYTASANAAYRIFGLEGPELTGLNTVVAPATSHVITGYFTTPGQADFTPLSNKDIGLRVQYLGTAGFPQGKFADDLMVLLGTEADQDADTTGDWDDALGPWVAGTLYTAGVAVVRPTTRNGKTYYCSVTGTAHATIEPTWGTVEGGETVDAGTLRWRCMHRQKMVVTLDATAGKVQERGWLHLTPVIYLAGAVAWVDPQASVTSS